jgi:hypothetical protein
LIFYHHYGKTIHCHGCLESFGWHLWRQSKLPCCCPF